jgi:hypothetical protein
MSNKIINLDTQEYKIELSNYINEFKIDGFYFEFKKDKTL